MDISSKIPQYNTNNITKMIPTLCSMQLYENQ